MSLERLVHFIPRLFEIHVCYESVVLRGMFTVHTLQKDLIYLQLIIGKLTILLIIKYGSLLHNVIKLFEVVTELSFVNFNDDRTVLFMCQFGFSTGKNFSVTEVSFGGQKCPFFFGDDRSVLLCEIFGQKCPFPFLKTS